MVSKTIVAALGAAAPALALQGRTVGEADICYDNKQLNLYWGQDSSSTRLEEYCKESKPDFISLAFMNVSPENAGETGYPGTNFAGHCWAKWYEKDGVESQLLDCVQVAEGAQACQDAGVKVLLSIGGVYSQTSNYSISTDEKGEEWAEFLWDAFGPKKNDYEGPRPFDTEDKEFCVDGFDFDVEHKFENQSPWIKMIQKLRELSSDLFITAAPQCPLSPQWFQMSDILAEVPFDALFIQFYNNGECDGIPGVEAWDRFNYGAWEEYASTEGCAQKDAKLFIGLPAQEGSNGYLDRDTVKEVLCDVIENPEYTHFGGVSLWDAARAFGNIEDDCSYSELIQKIIACGGCSEEPEPTSSASSTSSTSTSETSTSETSTSETTTSETSTSETSVTTSSDVSTSSSGPTSTTSSEYPEPTEDECEDEDDEDDEDDDDEEDCDEDDEDDEDDHEPTGTSTNDPHHPTGTSSNDPHHPTGTSSNDPHHPTGTSSNDPHNPTGTSSNDPHHPTGTSTNDPGHPTTTPPPHSYTTSTVYSTKTYTVTSCPPGKGPCHEGHVTTEIVPVYTTVCPADDDEPKPTDSPHYPGHGGNGGDDNDDYKCPGGKYCHGGSDEDNEDDYMCPGGKYCHGGDNEEPTTNPECPYGGSCGEHNGGEQTTTKAWKTTLYTTATVPKPSASHTSSGVAKPTGTGSGSGCYGAGCPSTPAEPTGQVPVTAGAGSIAFSLVAVVAAAVVAL